ncbi:hypothetical protein [Streptomyces sp. NPDC006645]|uniref:hypothetical protein n=1 Tax=Streptomyces sp. NPDC006645 TaxID=3157184 RepID=UPI00339EF773
MVLFGVAVGGVSACVAVEPPVGSGSGASGSGVGAVRGAPARAAVAPRIVQPQAREVLEAASPPRRTPAPRPSRQAGTDAVRPPAESPRRVTAVRPPAPPEPAAPTVPAVPTALPDLGAGLCALGTGYGSWAPGGPESRICREVYGG